MINQQIRNKLSKTHRTNNILTLLYEHTFNNKIQRLYVDAQGKELAFSFDDKGNKTAVNLENIKIAYQKNKTFRQQTSNKKISLKKNKTQFIRENELQFAKNLLNNFKEIMLNDLLILKHQKQQIASNYIFRIHTFYVDESIYDEVNQFKKELILNVDSKKIKKPKTLFVEGNQFKVVFRDPKKNEIKEILSKIEVDKLSELKLNEIEKDLDRHRKPTKTNYNKSKNVLFFKEEDLKHINFFITKASTGYRITKKDRKYQYIYSN
ncbi:MAG: hypothetical protein Q2306_02385 [Phytoplasma sp.]|uniref:hypothetical protein n=1 Tax=Phytoplasma sp. TaxID=2155 RepID=UPI002B417CAB|nr:hypothetical protein [Phytoplasma sp.]WRH06717.1 MAG: hypothetical protein Q2306_02385 [Phytoplasma sp.]